MTSFEIKRARGKTAVFSGTRQHIDFVPRLEDLCIQRLLNNLNNIEFVGDVPYYVLKPLLTKLTVDQLKRVEYFNPQFIGGEESDEPWKVHCQRHFEGQKPNKGESWRDLFERCEHERDWRIEKIAKKIKKHEKKAVPARQAQVVDHPLPGGKSRAISSKTVITKVTKIHPTSSSSSSSTHTTKTHVATTSTTVHPAAKAKKAAPLMQKSMQLFKSRFRR